MKLFLTTLILTLSLNLFAQTEWFEIPTGTEKQLNTISFGSSSVGYIGGNDSLLLKTIDGGETWDELEFTGVSFSLSSEHIKNLKFVDENVGFMTIGPSNGAYKTTDGGSTWMALTFAGTMCYNQGLFFWDADNGFVGGSGCFQGEHIEMYSNGNLSPVTINTPSFMAEDLVLDIDFLNTEFGLAVSPSRFLRTTDGGLSWDTIPSGITDLLTSIEIVNDTLAYAGYIDEESAGYGLMVTHDGGLTWGSETQMATFLYPDYNDVHETANGYLYSAAHSVSAGVGMIFENTGEGWWYYEAGQALRALDSYGDSTVFAVGDNGFVITNKDFEVNVAEKFFDNEPLSIYPNPAQDEIQFSIPGSSTSRSTQISIYNLEGKLVHEEVNSNSRVPVSSLASGSYFLEVKTEKETYRGRFLKR
jgi:photosystem II stability/assembly factor-like uncharacterized protein